MRQKPAPCGKPERHPATEEQFNSVGVIQLRRRLTCGRNLHGCVRCTGEGGEKVRADRIGQPTGGAGCHQLAGRQPDTDGSIQPSMANRIVRTVQYFVGRPMLNGDPCSQAGISAMHGQSMAARTRNVAEPA
jgi:hypothetical protein